MEERRKTNLTIFNESYTQSIKINRYYRNEQEEKRKISWNYLLLFISEFKREFLKKKILAIKLLENVRKINFFEIYKNKNTKTNLSQWKSLTNGKAYKYGDKNLR